MSFWDNLSAIMGPGFQTPNWMQDAYSSYGSPIKVGTPSASGLYGGDVDFSAPNSPYNSIDPYAYQFDKKKGASNLSADVIRAQYADYMQRFAPIEDFAVGLLRDRGTADGVFDIARARDSIANAGMNLQGQQERAMGRYGLNMTGNNISTSNQVTGATVGGLNAARFADEERRLAMLGGGGGGPSMGAQGGLIMAGLIGAGRSTLSQATGGFSDVAAFENARNITADQMKAARKAQRVSAVSQGAGIGASVGLTKVAAAKAAAANGTMATIGAIATPLLIGAGAALLLDSIFDIF